jgi:hypothetical protein
MGAVSRVDTPILIRVHPDVERSVSQNIDGGLDDIAWNQAFVNHRQIRPHEQPAIERCDGIPQLKRPN